MDSLKGNHKGWFLGVIPSFPADQQEHATCDVSRRQATGFWQVRPGQNASESRVVFRELRLQGGASVCVKRTASSHKLWFPESTRLLAYVLYPASVVFCFFS